MNIVVHITENPRIGPIRLQLQPSALTRVMISTHSPYSSQLCLSLHWLFQPGSFCPTSRWPLIGSPFSSHFLAMTTKSQISFWWHYLGSHAHLAPVIVIIGLECSHGLEEKWMGNWITWPESVGDISVAKKKRKWMTGREKQYVSTTVSSINRWWN